MKYGSDETPMLTEFIESWNLPVVSACSQAFCDTVLTVSLIPAALYWPCSRVQMVS